MSQFLGIEVLVVVVEHGPDRVVVGIEGLDDDSSWRAGAPRAPCNLGEQLKGSLGGSEVGKVETDVGDDDTHQAYLRKVMTLGDHLGTHHDVDRPVVEAVKHALRVTAFSRGVAVESCNPRLGKLAADLLFEPLGPDTQ